MLFEIINGNLAVEFGVKAPDFATMIKSLEKVLAHHSLLGDKLDKISFNIVFVSKSEMTDLNREFRMTETSTDVLSFPISNSMAEVYLCPEYINDKLIENKQDISLTDEVFTLTVHGILHIAGYDHTGYLHWGGKYEGDEEMFKVQAEIVAQIKGDTDMEGVK